MLLKSRTMTALENFSNVKILVIGDLMLDQYLWGVVSRISPEAPVPVVKLGRTSVAAGGAANVAANVSGLGAKAILIGIIGNDSNAVVLRELIEKDSGIDCRLIQLDGRETTVKTRIVAHNQHVVRLDQETTTAITETETEASISIISKAIDEVDAVIVSDYAKGFLTNGLISEIFRLARKSGKVTLADPKSKDLSKYRGATIITPNLKEASEAVQFLLESREQISKAGNDLRAGLGLESVLITEGEHGMTLFDGADSPFHLEALARDVFDTTGAGDTVIAAFSVAAASGMSFREAATIANVAAGIVVGHIGTTVVTKADIEAFISSQPEIARGI